MIQEILPACVHAVEARHDCSEAQLFAEEQALVERAVEKRRREFATARLCAHAALRELGEAAAPILTGERGEPLWPTGVVGSITHCEGYRACAVGRSSELVTIGIDAEPNERLPDGVLADIALPEEMPALRELAAEHPDVHWDRLLFSAKESVYKAWFPLAKRWLGFEDASLLIDPSAGTYEARLLVAGPSLNDGPLVGFSGRFAVGEGIIVAAIALTAA
jgi:4'-phosphopantetheinyl transferase EntD